jgi:transglutaminase-like putative cysteine protease
MTTVLDAPARRHVDPGATPRIGADMRRIALALLATALSVGSLAAVIELGRWLPKSLAVVAVVFALGVGLRAMRVPRPVVIVVQAVVALCVVVAMQARRDATWNFVPGPGALENLFDHWDDGIGQLTRIVPPDPATAGVTTVAVLSVAGLAIAVDALAVAYRRPDWAGVALVGLAAVPAATLPNGWRGVWFLLPALGYLLLLFDGNADRVRQWGDQTIVDPASGRRRSLRVGAAILVLSFAIPGVLPHISGGLFNNTGIGLHIQEPIKVQDPLVAMRNFLVRKSDDPLFTQNTDSAWPDEAYLHSVVLEDFNGQQWKSGDRQVIKFDGTIPDSVGYGPAVPTSPVRAELSATPEFEADYVPMPRPADRIAIDGNWRLAPVYGDVLSFSGRDQFHSRKWSVDGVDRSPDQASLKGPVPQDPALAPYLRLPKLPPLIAAEAKRITKGAKGPLEQGIKLQQYFRDPKNFTYDLRPYGSGTKAITTFLTTKRGYAEQAASTMAVMARTLGIPARLGVGFTAGEAVAGGIRMVSAHDAHAWPELFLPQAGWSRFEPTSAKAPGAPRPLHWLVPAEKPTPPNPDDKDIEQPQPQPPPPPSAAQPQSEPEDPCAVDPSACPPREVPKDSHPNIVLRVYLWSLLALLLLASPYILRTAITRHRWVCAKRGRLMVGAGPEGAAFVARVAWFELRDAAIDLGYAWPATRTPRQAGQSLVEKAQLSPEAQRELDELLHTVEKVRYAPATTEKLDAFRLRTAVVRVRRELAEAVGRTDRVRAWVLPRSLGPWLRGAAASARRAAGSRRGAAAPGRRRRRRPLLNLPRSMGGARR